MASKWFYRVDGREYGPVSSNEIRELAISGRLRPTDHIRKDGSDDWRVAGESAKLFPGGVSNIREAVSELAADFTAADANKVFSAAAATAGQAAAKTGTTLKTHTSAMKASAALTAEKTKITSLSLPAAYSALGKHCYEAGMGRTSFPAEFAELEVLSGSLESLRNQNTSSPAPTTFTDKARHLAGQGLDFANTQKLSLQQNASFARLGKAIYECDDHALAPADLRTPLDTLHSRLKEIDTALATHKNVLSSNGLGLSPLILGASVLLFWPVGLFLLWRHPTLSRNRGWWAAGIAWALLVMIAVGRVPAPTKSIDSHSPTPAVAATRSQAGSQTPPRGARTYQEGYDKGVSQARQETRHWEIGRLPTYTFERLKRSATGHLNLASEFSASGNPLADFQQGYADGYMSIAAPYIRREQ